MARSYAKSAAVKRGILDACVAAFGENGFHGASMAEIARRAGISHTGLLHHFPRKEDLLTAVLSMQDARTARFLEEHAAVAGTQDPVTLLQGILASMAERTRAPGLLQLSAVLTAEASVPSHPAHAYFAKRFEAVRSFLTRVYAEAAAQGRLRGDLPPAVLAASTIALADGLLTQRLYAPEAIDVEGMLAQHIGELVEGFRGESADA
jgi:AcrR family transcriptional regulator